MNKLSRFLVIAIVASSFLFAFSQRGSGSYKSGRYFTDSLLEPGDEIVDMVITTGVKNAFPLWAVCAPKKVDDYSIKADCGDLSYDNLAIGHTLGVMDLVDPSTDWEELNWEMFVDGHHIDLSAFGVYEFVHPDFPSKPLGEVFRVIRIWDVVLINPTPGMHRIEGQVHDGEAAYTWILNFTVPALGNR